MKVRVRDETKEGRELTTEQVIQEAAQRLYLTDQTPPEKIIALAVVMTLSDIDSRLMALWDVLDSIQTDLRRGP